MMEMELFKALESRRSCRNYQNLPLEEDKLQSILQAGGWAPSVMNLQPWRFFVIKNPARKQHLKQSCEALAQSLFEASGWKWLSKYSFAFLTEAPVLIAVAANPKDTGADQFIPGRGTGYAYSCCAAVQNMLLAAYALDVGTLWFTLYDTDPAKEILGIPPELDLVSIVVAGYAIEVPKPVARKPVVELTAIVD
jgi:5,6-dimethylbenzimidazole synthase